MRKYILSILVVTLGIIACNPSLQEEISEVEALLLSLKDNETALFAVDTSRVFNIKRKMQSDLVEFNKLKDTLTREEAFKIDDIFASKKKIFRLEGNYGNLVAQLGFSKKQLNNLKQDLENGLIRKEDFTVYIAKEKAAIEELQMNINKSIQGVETGLQKFELDRKELLEIIKKRTQKAMNE